MPKLYIKLLGETSRPTDIADPFDIRLSIDDVINARGAKMANSTGNRWRKRYEELSIEAIKSSK